MTKIKKIELTSNTLQLLALIALFLKLQGQVHYLLEKLFAIELLLFHSKAREEY